MTKIIGDSGDLPLKAPFPSKPGVPAGQKAPAADEVAKQALAQQSHKLELSKSKLPASELQALRVHFAEQKGAMPQAGSDVVPLGDDFKQAEAHPIYGAPVPPKIKWLHEKMIVTPDGIRLIYGAPVPTRVPEEQQQGKEGKDKDAQPMEPRLIYGAPAPTRQKDGWHWPELLTPSWPNEMMLIYGAPTIKLINKQQF